LAAPDTSKGKDKDKIAKRAPKHVELRAAVALLRDVEKCSRAEAALQLLHAIIAGNEGAYIGVAAADVMGIKVCVASLWERVCQVGTAAFCPHCSTVQTGQHTCLAWQQHLPI
jgi:hypothetical protein